MAYGCLEEVGPKRKPRSVGRTSLSGAKVNDDMWVTIGAAWSAQLKDGTGYSLKINTFPAAWNGDERGGRWVGHPANGTGLALILEPRGFALSRICIGTRVQLQMVRERRRLQS